MLELFIPTIVFNLVLGINYIEIYAPRIRFRMFPIIMINAIVNAIVICVGAISAQDTVVGGRPNIYWVTCFVFCVATFMLNMGLTLIYFINEDTFINAEFAQRHRLLRKEYENAQRARILHANADPDDGDGTPWDD